MKEMQLLLLKCLFLSISLYSTYAQNETENTDESDLLMSIVIFREGDRTPISVQPTDPHKARWLAAGLGVLNEVGRIQMFALGLFLQERYRKKILETSISTKSLAVYSVGYERYIQSANLVYEGLIARLPETILKERVPIITNSSVTTKLVEPCPAYDQELQKAIVQDDTVIDENEKGKDIYALIEKNTQCPCKCFLDVKKCVDPMLCEKSEGLGLPKWCNRTSYKRIMNLLDMDWKVEASNPKLLNLRMQPFVDAMSKKIKNYVDGVETGFQLNLFSTDSVTIPVLLESFGVENMEPHLPKFGAALFVELRKIGEKHIVNFFYKPTRLGVLKKLSIKGCGEDCEFKQILEILPPMLKKRRLSC